MNETYVTIAGNVVGEPQVRMTRADVPFVTFRVASNVRRVDYKSGEYVDAGTNFVNVTAFRSLGVNLANSLRKGQPVLVHGRMRINQWTNGDRTGTTVEVDAYNVGHDMSLGQSTFQRVAKPQLNQSDRLADPAVQEASEALDRGASEPEARDVDPSIAQEPSGEDDAPQGPGQRSLGLVRPAEEASADGPGGEPGDGTGDQLDAVLAADSDDYVLAGAGQR